MAVTSILRSGSQTTLTAPDHARYTCNMDMRGTMALFLTLKHRKQAKCIP
jgi:hypothetical protein